MRVAVLNDYGGWLASALRRHGLWEVPGIDEVRVMTETMAEDALVQWVAGCQAVIAIRERTRFTAGLLQRLPDLRLIAQTGSQVLHIDLAAATRLGVAVMADRAPNRGSIATAELALGLLLAVARGIARYDRVLHAGGWESPYGLILAGKTLGIIGLGRVGGHLARLAAVLGMRVLAWSPHLTDERARAQGARRVELATLLQESDAVSVHVVLTEATRGLLGREQLALLKPGAILINTARGPIVDEAALVEALKGGRLAGAGLDVFGEEPLPEQHPLRRLPNVVLTPHAGWPVDAAYDDFAAAVTGLIKAYLEGDYRKVLNPQALSRRPPSPSAG